jgi:hypothetical protein
MERSFGARHARLAIDLVAGGGGVRRFRRAA